MFIELIIEKPKQIFIRKTGSKENKANDKKCNFRETQKGLEISDVKNTSNTVAYIKKNM